MTFYLRSTKPVTEEEGALPENWPIVAFDEPYMNVIVAGPIAKVALALEQESLDELGTEIVDDAGVTHTPSEFIRAWKEKRDA